MKSRPGLVLMARATGYVGGRLLKALESAGHRVRCPARRPEFLRATAAESTSVDSRSAHMPYPPEKAFRPIRRIGGETGWYYADWLWRLRGFLALLVGGAALRRGIAFTAEEVDKTAGS